MNFKNQTIFQIKMEYFKGKQPKSNKMSVPKFSLKKQKNIYLLKPSSSLGSLQGREIINTTPLRSESFIYHFLGFVRTFRQLFSSELLLRATPRTIKLGTKSFWQIIVKLCMLWIWSYPLSKKEFFVKLAVPKKQAKSLKTICDKLCFYCICRLWSWNF